MGAPCPLPVEGTDIGTTEEAESFMDLLVIALHWNGSPESAPTSALLAIPEATSHGVHGAVSVASDCYFSDGSFVEVGNVVLMLASSEYLARILAESTPATAEIVTFVADVGGAAPL
eukprot:6201673-Amphidinium_carterae.1